MKKLTPVEEQMLLDEIIKNGKKEKLIQQYWALIYYIVKKTFRQKYLLFSDDDIFELRNEVFLKLLDNDCKRLKVYNKNMGVSLTGWIVLITIRTVIDCVKKKDPVGINKRKQTISFENISNFKKNVNTQKNIENNLFLNQAIDKLPFPYKDVLQLYLIGYSMDEIAKNIGKSVPATVTIKSRAVKKIKEII